MPNDDNTLSAHLARARSQRDPAKLREHAKQIARLPYSDEKLAPCKCGLIDGKHKSICPVFRREKRRNERKEQGQ